MCYLVVQRSIYRQMKVKRPCSAYALFQSDFIKARGPGQDVRDAMRDGTLPDVRLLRSYKAQTFSNDI